MTHPSDQRAYYFKIDTTIKKIKNSLQRQLTQSGCDLTVDQWVLLDHIYRNPGVSQNALVELTTKDAPTVTRIIDLLTKKALTERRINKEDRRKSLVFLTPAGRAKYKAALPLVVEIRRQGWGNLSDEDYEQFVRIMDSIYQNFNK